MSVENNFYSRRRGDKGNDRVINIKNIVRRSLLQAKVQRILFRNGGGFI